MSSDGQYLASGSDDGCIKLWDARTGFCLNTFEVCIGSIKAIALSPDGRYLAVTPFDANIRIWDVEASCHLRTIEKGVRGDGYEIDFVPTFSFDGQRLISVVGNEIKEWDPISGQCHRSLQIPIRNATPVALLAQDHLFALVAPDLHSIWLWNIATSIVKGLDHEVVSLNYGSRVTSIAHSPDKQHMASGYNDGFIMIWAIPSGEKIQVLTDPTGLVQTIAFSPNGHQIASGSSDFRVRIWDATTGACILRIEGHLESITCLVFLSDGNVASGSADCTLKVWNTDLKVDHDMATEYEELIESIKLSSNNELVATGSWDGTIKIWVVTTGQHRATLEGHNNRIMSLNFSPNDKYIASISEDNSVKIWGIATSSCLATLKCHIESVAFSPNSRSIAFGFADGSMEIWNLMPIKHWNIMNSDYEMMAHGSPIHCITFSPDGVSIASSSRDETITIWNISSGYSVKHKLPLFVFIWSMAYSPDGKCLVSCSRDGTVHIMDIETGSFIACCEVGDYRLKQSHTLHFDKTGNYILTNCGGLSIAELIFLKSSKLPLCVLSKSSCHPRGYGTTPDMQWFTYNGKRLAWIPVEHQTAELVVSGPNIIFACESGSVLFFHFTDEAPW
ncbi:Vegetative incompatibility protein HET-E-1 [Cladobotryum mycophilum]|uniref:Vegetative incompatibility protein HET-E-1 n=1 Tax=Cladobotryum mycophilum TaxID=491253 RepID=A0ABR0SAQ1_9HYPO